MTFKQKKPYFSIFETTISAEKILFYSISNFNFRGA